MAKQEPPGQQIGLFGEAVPEAAARRARAQAAFDPTSLPVPDKRGPACVRFGGSTWTYEGWQGAVYRDVKAYGSRFSQLSLGEYARDPRFRTASVDTLYYAAPRERLALLTRYRELIAGVPGFDLCPKVWHGVTVSRYTKQQQAQFRLSTEINRDFLDPEVFLGEVLWPLKETLGPSLGPLILEIQESEIAPDAFAAALDRFLAGTRARAAFRIGVELRTLAHFTRRYLATLAAHGAAHICNAWTRMPPVGWQHDRAAPHETDLFMVRAMLRPGKLPEGARAPQALLPGSRYEEPGEDYEPFDRIHVRLRDVRDDILRVVREAGEGADVYVLINNQLEGHAPGTIEELQRELWG